MAKKNLSPEEKLKLEDLQKVEALNAKVNTDTDDVDDEEKSSKRIKNNHTIVDGYKIISRNELPHEGLFYPESWQFAYRCPTSIEVANFSTLNEQDQPAIIVAVEDLIRKCVVIYDKDKGTQISSGQINDSDRTFFMIKLREEYLPGTPITYRTVCTLCKEPFNVILGSKSLIYEEQTEKLIQSFDGRKFHMEMDLDEPIEFLMPTIESSSRIFKYIVRVYKDNQNDKEKAEHKLVYDKQFLLFVPYLYVTGHETIKELGVKYKKIQKDDKKFKAYLEIASQFKIENADYVNAKCHCGSVEEAQLRFPGGWKKYFIGRENSTGYFN